MNDERRPDDDRPVFTGRFDRLVRAIGQETPREERRLETLDDWILSGLMKR